MKKLPTLSAKLKALPGVGAVSAWFGGLPEAGWLSSVGRKFAAGTLLTKLGISALSVSMVGATGLGGYLAVKQFVGSAGSQYVITSPSSGTIVSSDFAINTEFRAASNVSAFNIVITLDGRTITSKVGSAIDNGQKRAYVFSGGVNGANAFPVDNLSPGSHTIRSFARTGTLIGQGTLFSSDEAGFNVKPNNIVTVSEGVREIPASSLPINSSPRASAPSLAQKLAWAGQRNSSVLEDLSSQAQTAAANLQQLVNPKVSAHNCDGCRHGDLDVLAKIRDSPTDERLPGVTIRLKHDSVSCHGGDVQVTNAPGPNTPGGDANFRGCGVTTQLSGDPVEDTRAIYNVKVIGVPAGFVSDGLAERQFAIEHGKNKDMTFFFKHVGGSDPGSDPGNPGGGDPSNPGASYNHSPGDGPLLAVTKLGVNTARVDVFGYQTINNLPANQVQSVTLNVDGTQRASRADFSTHPSHRGTLLDFSASGINLKDGQDHTLVFKATNDNGASNSATLIIRKAAAPKPDPPPTGGDNNPKPQPSANTGSIRVVTYAHDKAGQPLNKAGDNRVGNVYITPESIGTGPARQCPRSGGLTNADRKAGDNFGLIHFKDCPVADQAGSNKHAKKYRVSMNIPTGFTLDQGFNNNTGATVNGNVVYRTITVRKNQQTEVSFLLIGSNGSVENPNNPSDGPTPNPPGSGPLEENEANIIVKVVYDVYLDQSLPLFLVSGIFVSSKSIGTNKNCKISRAITGSSQATDNGVAVLRRCPLANNGGPKQYNISVENLDPQYEIVSSSQIQVSKKGKNEILIILRARQ